MEVLRSHDVPLNLALSTYYFPSLTDSDYSSDSSDDEPIEYKLSTFGVTWNLLNSLVTPSTRKFLSGEPFESNASPRLLEFSQKMTKL